MELREYESTGKKVNLPGKVDLSVCEENPLPSGEQKKKNETKRAFPLAFPDNVKGIRLPPALKHTHWH